LHPLFKVTGIDIETFGVFVEDFSLTVDVVVIVGLISLGKLRGAYRLTKG